MGRTQVLTTDDGQPYVLDLSYVGKMPPPATPDEALGNLRRMRTDAAALAALIQGRAMAIAQARTMQAAGRAWAHGGKKPGA